jgi:23S rRNA (adenine2030-N6)-methyltransferase
MNYRHAYHAGNFADVLKHVVLARVITYLKLKPQPFRVIDTHAGAGRYDVTGYEAGKTQEWRDGIGRLTGADLTPAESNVLAPYLSAVAAFNSGQELQYYPGSPLIARHLIRPCDHLVANELHPEDAALLRAELRRSPGCKVLTLDAWLAIKSLLPPPERRGIVLIDPPFERPDEFECLTDAVQNGLKRFANGVYIVWYPVKDRPAADRFISSISAETSIKMLDVRLKISEPFAGLGLTETGVMVLNPPYTLRDELQVVLPMLANRLGEGRGAGFTLNAVDTAVSS